MALRRPEARALLVALLGGVLVACAGGEVTEDQALGQHAFDGRTGHEVLQLDQFRYTLRYYAAPQADVTAMENLLLDQATRICGFPGFRRGDPVEQTIAMPANRTPDLVDEQYRQPAPGPEYLHWVELDIDCDPAADR